MNSYITLDGKQYATAHGDWTPGEERPLVIKRLMSGNSNVTFGSATFLKWRGSILADVTPQASYGDVDDLRTSLRKLEVLSFTDHYSDTYDVVVDRNVDPHSLSPMWDADDNVWKINVTLIKV